MDAFITLESQEEAVWEKEEMVMLLEIGRYVRNENQETCEGGSQQCAP